MNINESINQNMIELDDDELEAVSGGTGRYVTCKNEESNVRLGPGMNYESVGKLHEYEAARYTGKYATDERGVIWYKIKWNNGTAWISSRSSRKIKM